MSQSVSCNIRDSLQNSWKYNEQIQAQNTLTFSMMSSISTTSTISPPKEIFTSIDDVNREILLRLPDEILFPVCLLCRYTVKLANAYFWKQRFVQKYRVEMGSDSGVNSGPQSGPHPSFDYRAAYLKLRNYDNDQIMFWAAENGVLPMVKAMIEKGCNHFGVDYREKDQNSWDFQKNTLFLVTIRGGHLNVIKYLLEEISPIIKASAFIFKEQDILSTYIGVNNDYFRDSVARADNVEIFKYFMDKYDFEFDEMFSHSVRHGSLNLIKFFVEEMNVDPNMKMHKTTMLSKAIFSFDASDGYNAFGFSAGEIRHDGGNAFGFSSGEIPGGCNNSKRVDTVKYLLAKGAKINAPLYEEFVVAFDTQNLQVTKFVFDYVHNHFDLSTIKEMIQIGFNNSYITNEDIGIYIIERENLTINDINSNVVRGWIKDHRIYRNRLLKFLINRSSIDKSGLGLEILKECLDHDRWALVELLIKRGLDIHISDDIILRTAVQHNKFSIVSILLGGPTEHGPNLITGTNIRANIHAGNDFCLYYAAKKENFAMFQLLFEKGATINDETKIIVSRKRNSAIFKYLWKMGYHID